MQDHLIATQICIQARAPVFLWGAPGVGKTTTLEAIAPAIGEPMWTVILSIREPSDQGGLPIVRPDGVAMHPPRWAVELGEEGHGIVFWDEFNTAPPTTQSSALRVIHGGYAGDLELPRETSHVAAGNPPEMVQGGYDLTAAIANRWVHLDWPLPASDWCAGMVAGWPEPPIVRLPATWRAGLAHHRGLLASFVQRRPELLLALPSGLREQGRAWPSPRTWSRAAELLTAARAAGFEETSSVARVLVEGCVGAPAAGELYAWMRSLDLRDPEEYLADPLGTPLPKRQDQLMATLDAVASAALDAMHPEPERVVRYYSGWKVLGRLLPRRSDVAIPAARVLIAKMPYACRGALPPELDGFLPILKEAGLGFERG